MKSILLFILLCPGLVFSQKKECDCYKVYTGKFYSNENYKDTIFYDRTKDRQIEWKGDAPEEKFKLNIIWLSDCKYILRRYVYNSSLKEKVMKGDILAKIIETGEDYFKVQVWAKKVKKFEMNIYVYPPGSKL